MVTSQEFVSKLGSKISITPKERYDRVKHCFDTKRSAACFLNKFSGRVAAIVGGGPDLPDCLDELRHLIKWQGAVVFAINKTHDYLIENGIVPDFCVLLDPRDWVATYVTPHKDVKYLVASQVSPKVWEKLEGFDTYCWHAFNLNRGSKEFREIDVEKFRKFSKGKPYFACGGGVTAGLRAWTMACSPYMGFSYIHFFGFASSADDKGNLYPYQKDSSVSIDTQYFRISLMDEKTGRYINKIYHTNYSMQAQATNIEVFFRQYAQAILAKRLPATSFIFHGKGLVPDWAALKGIHHNPKYVEELRALNDIWVMPKPIVLDPKDQMFNLTVNIFNAEKEKSLQQVNRA